MSQKDLQFIERALVHPWMFWVYFWKWPRIVRQACAEYDLLAKERDAAKAAHERSERANKIVRDWIHVTHRLSTTPEAIRAIFAAGKRLSILLVFFVVINTYGQAPPYLRNQWTTNANPLALKVISTNGVRVATNIWEVDFTNTASVTVSAVSNANKVMVSFTGSASSGSSSLTNALLHAGPTNGSVDALILTAGNGVTLTTSGTNREISLSTNILIGSSLWTNFSVADVEGGVVRGLRDSNGVMRVASFGVNFLTNLWGVPSSVISLGAFVGGTNTGTYSANIFNAGDFAGEDQILLGSSSIANIGLSAGENQYLTNSRAVFNFGSQAGISQLLTNSSFIFNIGNDAGASAKIGGRTSSQDIFNLGSAAGFNAIVDNSQGVFSIGRYSGGFLNASNALYIFNYGYGAGGGGSAGVRSVITNSLSVFNYGYEAGQKQTLLQSSNIYSYGTYASSNHISSGANRVYSYGAYASSDSAITNSTDIYGFGSYAFRDAHIHSSHRIFGLDYDAFEHASLTNCQSISGYGFEAFESSILAGCSNIVAIGPHSGTNLTLTGVSNIVMVGNIGTNVPTTDEFYLGRAQNTYRMPGNIGTIRGVSGYSWPTAHSAGVWTNDGAGVTGWKPLSDFSGTGSGVTNAIGSIFTNNVLAGGPGLTELEFTNTATVTWAATTNAGRVTMSATSAGGGSGIATNSGTGWDTTFRSVSTNTVPLRIESEAGLNLTNFFQAATNGGVPFFVINSNKFVGIGTNGPLAPLHIVPTVQEADSLRLDHTNGTPRIRFGTYPSAPSFGGLWLGDVTRNGNNIALACDNTGFLIVNGPSTVNFQTAGAARWTINSSGHFVAGTDNTYDTGEPGAKRPRNTYVANVNTSASAATTATNRIAITATGYTNTLTVGSVAVSVDVYFDAATAALQDSAGNALHTFQAGTNITAHLKPNWRLVGTTMAGTAIAH